MDKQNYSQTQTSLLNKCYIIRSLAGISLKDLTHRLGRSKHTVACKYKITLLWFPDDRLHLVG